MNAFFRNMALVLCVWLPMTGICLGKQVYLRDGGIIDCKSFKRSGNVVNVLVNRDTEVAIDLKEIDLKRTFHTYGEKSHHGRKKISSGAVRPQ